MRTLPLILIGALCVLASCQVDTESGPDLRRQTLEELGQNVIMPMHLDFEAQTIALQEASRTLCADPSMENLTAAQQAWNDARRPWKMMEILAFGPYKEEPIRLGPKIDFWPVRPDTIADVMNGDSELSADVLAALGAPARGLPVVEVLLYSDNQLVPASDEATLLAFNEADASVRRCEYLTAATEDLKNNATALREAWDPEVGDFLGELVTAGEGSQTFRELVDGVGEVANRMAFTCENIRRDKLGKALGLQTDLTRQPELLESHYSGRTAEDIADNLRGIEAFYLGAYGDNDGMGFSDYTKRRGLDLDQRFYAQYDAAQEALAAIPDPTSEALTTHPEEVEAPFDPLRELQRLIQTDLLESMGVSETFNDADGD